MDTAFDTQVLSRVYEGLDCTVFYTPTRCERRAILKAIRDDDGPIVLLGHGTPKGLLDATFYDFIIESRDVELLRQKTIIGIWCYASEFADRYGLHGFFTSMFISNMDEAIEHCKKGIDSDRETAVPDSVSVPPCYESKSSPSCSREKHRQ